MKVKICGLSTMDAVKAADKADYAGFVVGSPRSSRNISLQRFEELRPFLTHAKPVLVTVNHELQFLHQLRQYDAIIQLHGFAREFYSNLSNTAIGLNLNEFQNQEYMALNRHQYLSIDSTSKDGYGGTGTPWDWTEINKQGFDVLIAGGITINNFEEALEKTRADGIDVSSGVEENGDKDPELIRELIKKIRTYN